MYFLQNILQDIFLTEEAGCSELSTPLLERSSPTIHAHTTMAASFNPSISFDAKSRRIPDLPNAPNSFLSAFSSPSRVTLRLRPCANLRVCRKRTKILSSLAQDVEETDEESERSTESVSDGWLIRAEKGFNFLLTDVVIRLLDAVYGDRHYARFYVLETIARVPYFAFVSVLHMYESFGWWRRADYLKVHFAESWNELHHLLVMEALGGDEKWIDRFLAQHIAVVYFFLTALMYTISPRMAYHLSECVERHAYSTYDKFIKQHGDELMKLPAPEVAIKYYTEGDLYMFDEFQTNRMPESRRPKVENLYDVFVNIREDEAEHCKTMVACQTQGNLRSPHTVKCRHTTEYELPPAECSGIVECLMTSSSFASRAKTVGKAAPTNNH